MQNKHRINDMLPIAKKPKVVEPVAQPKPEAQTPENFKRIPQQPIEEPKAIKPPEPSRKKLVSKVLVWVVIVLGALLGGALISAWLWYSVQTSPIADDKSILIPVVVEVGSTPSEIGEMLADKSVIRNSFAFDVYTYLSSTRSKLQAGSYRLSPAESTQQIVEHLVNGKVDQYSITFFPGATLRDTTSRPSNQKTDVVTVLSRAGFSEDEINEGLADKYDSPLFEGKPSNTDLEGYVYGETYNFGSGSSVKDILSYTFDQYYKDLTDNNLIAGFKKQGLNLYKAITLASIIQREVSDPTDQKQVAQVFYLRLKQGMVLGSDVTYQYIADKLGVARSTDLENPYNTRKYAGLPPGPISSPGINALTAVAEPATGDYLYFLSGDDDKTYFARTDAQHEANRAKYCVVKCQIL